MSSGGHKDRVTELFLRVCDLDPHEQKRVLDSECSTDPGLRAEVESLLAHDQPTRASALPGTATSPVRAWLIKFSGIFLRTSSLPM